MAGNGGMKMGNSSATASPAVLNAVKGIDSAVVTSDSCKSLASIGLAYDDSSDNDGGSAAEEARSDAGDRRLPEGREEERDLEPDGNTDVDVGVDLGYDLPFEAPLSEAQAVPKSPIPHHDLVPFAARAEEEPPAERPSVVSPPANPAPDSATATVDADSMEQLVELDFDPNDDILAEESGAHHGGTPSRGRHASTSQSAASRGGASKAPAQRAMMSPKSGKAPPPTSV